jgi:hypothetical protein
MLPNKDTLLYFLDLYSRGRFKGEFHETDWIVLFDGLQNSNRYFTSASVVNGNLKWPTVVTIRCKLFCFMKITYSGNPSRNTPVIFSTV